MSGFIRKWFFPDLKTRQFYSKAFWKKFQKKNKKRNAERKKMEMDCENFLKIIKKRLVS